MDSKKVVSTGGKRFTVSTNGDEVHLSWVDKGFEDGDALFAREDGITLGAALLLSALGAEIRPGTLFDIARRLEARAEMVLRPESRTYAEYQAVATLLRSLVSEDTP
jgi:hypothetical protein